MQLLCTGDLWNGECIRNAIGKCTRNAKKFADYNIKFFPTIRTYSLHSLFAPLLACPWLPDRNINNNLDPASATPCTYFLNSIALPMFYKELSPSSNLLLSLSLILSPAKARNTFKELLPSRISYNHSTLSISNDTKSPSINLLQTFLSLPLCGLMFQS